LNAFDNLQVDVNAFTYADITGQDSWSSFAPTFSLTAVGDLTSVGRFRIVGKSLQFQVTVFGATSIASTAGTSYMNLPKAAKGLAGIAVMTDATTKIAVGVCHFDITNSRVYLPSQSASGDTFTICGSYEV